MTRQQTLLPAERLLRRSPVHVLAVKHDPVSQATVAVLEIQPGHRC